MLAAPAMGACLLAAQTLADNGTVPKDYDTRIIDATGACVVVEGAEALALVQSAAALDDSAYVTVSAGSSLGGGLDIQFLVEPLLAETPGWVDALEAAAIVYESRISDDVVITVRINSVPSSGGIASVTTPRLALGYASVRAALVADASGRESALMAALPAPDAVFETEVGQRSTTAAGGLRLTAPQARAIGLPGALPAGDPDTTMTFNLSRTYDLDPSDGITAGSVDFRYVVVHELGHVLGFITGTDYSASVVPTAFDLFRFGSGLPATDPESIAHFRSYPRELRRGFEAAVDTVGAVVGAGGPWRLSIGIIGDGRQASHWKDESLLGLQHSIGVMDPTYNPITTFPGYPQYLSVADRLAFSLMGWDVVWYGPCPSDLSGDGRVNSDDMSAMLGEWGPCAPGCPGDVNGDGRVDSIDIAILLGAWGACQ